MQEVADRLMQLFKPKSEIDIASLMSGTIEEVQAYRLDTARSQQYEDAIVEYEA
jgi:hypothetical protein